MSPGRADRRQQGHVLARIGRGPLEQARRDGALALAAITLSLGSACGSEVAPPAQIIGNVNRPQAPAVEQGTARLQSDDSAQRPMSGQWWMRGDGKANAERNLNRKDFNDNGGA